MLSVTKGLGGILCGHLSIGEDIEMYRLRAGHKICVSYEVIGQGRVLAEVEFYKLFALYGFPE